MLVSDLSLTFTSTPLEIIFEISSVEPGMPDFRGFPRFLKIF